MKEDTRADDVRAPKSQAELASAIEMAKTKLESIALSLRDKRVEDFPSREEYDAWRNRARAAHRVWENKFAELQYWSARFEADADPERLRLEAKIGQVTADWNLFVARLGWLQNRGHSIRLRQLVSAYIERLPAGFFEAYCAEEAEKAVARDEVHS